MSEAPSSTRATRKLLTRRLLLEAAADVIAEKGFHAASLMDIASRAGVTTGAIYSNFRNKESLLAAVVQEMQPAVGMVPSEGLAGKSVAQHLVDFAVEAGRYADTPASKRLAMLQMEFIQLALRDPALLSDAIAQDAPNKAEMVSLLGDLDEVPEPGAPPPPVQLAELFGAVVQGLQQHRLLDPGDVPDSLFRWAVLVILRAARDYR